MGNEAEERVFLGEHQIFPQEPGLHSVVALDDPVRLNAAQHDTEETLVRAAATSAATATATLTPQHIRRVQRCTEGGTFGCFLRVAGQVPNGGPDDGELEQVHESHERKVCTGSFRLRSASHAGAVLQVVGAGLLGPIRVDGGLVPGPARWT